MKPRAGQTCLFCGGDASERKHVQRCDGRQGTIEAAEVFDPTLAFTARHELPVAAPPSVESRKPLSFDEYHANNPAIYARLKRYALDAVRAGRTHLGIGMLYERVRWDSMIAAEDGEYKVNNNFRAAYARLLMAQEPALAGLFETRVATAYLPGTDAEGSVADGC